MNGKAGDTVTWGIRPENVQLVKKDTVLTGNGTNWFEAVIRNVVNKGTSRLVSLEANGSEAMLMAEVANHEFDTLKLGVGDECMVLLEKDHIVVF